MALGAKHTTLLGALVLAAIAASTGHARAFSVENQGAGSNGGNANFGDPDDRIMQNFSGGGSSSVQSGSSLQFGTPMTTNGSQSGAGPAPLRFGPQPPSSGDHN
jgi:hypothetical protein